MPSDPTIEPEEHLYQEPNLPPTPPPVELDHQTSTYSNFLDKASSHYQNITETLQFHDTEHPESGQSTNKSSSERPEFELKSNELPQSRSPQTFNVVYKEIETREECESPSPVALLDSVPQVKLLDMHSCKMRRQINEIMFC